MDEDLTPECGTAVQWGANIGAGIGMAAGGVAGIEAAAAEGPAATLAGASTIAGLAAMGEQIGQGTGALIGYGVCETAYGVEAVVHSIGDWYRDAMTPPPEPTVPESMPASPGLNLDMAFSQGTNASWGDFHSVHETQVAWGGTDHGFSGHDSYGSHDQSGGGHHHESIGSVAGDL